MKKILILFVILLFSQLFSATFNVRDFGAVGNGVTLDRDAIQSTVDACVKNGGGTVYFPAGDYLTGTITLSNNITLNLEAGATIWASDKKEDFGQPVDQAQNTQGFVVYAKNAKNINIIGQGTIHGTGFDDYGKLETVKYYELDFRTSAIGFSNCENITLRDVSFLLSDSWAIRLNECNRVNIDGVTILNNYMRENSGGIVPLSSKNVTITNCHIVAGDNGINIETKAGIPSENFLIQNCTIESSSTAIKFGSQSFDVFRDIHVANCNINNSRVGIGFNMKDGGVIERVTFSDLSIKSFKDKKIKFDSFPIHMDIEKRNEETPLGQIRDIIFRNLQIEAEAGMLIQGMPESPITNLTMENITFNVKNAIDYKNRKKYIADPISFKSQQDTLFARKPTYASLAYVHDLTIDNFNVMVPSADYTKFDRSALSGHFINRGLFQIIRRSTTSTDKRRPIVELENCQNIVFTENQMPPGDQFFLGLDGENTKNIFLLNDYLKNKINISKNVPKKEVNLSQK